MFIFDRSIWNFLNFLITPAPRFRSQSMTSMKLLNQVKLYNSRTTENNDKTKQRSQPTNLSSHSTTVATSSLSNSLNSSSQNSHSTSNKLQKSASNLNQPCDQSSVFSKLIMAKEQSQSKNSKNQNYSGLASNEYDTSISSTNIDIDVLNLPGIPDYPKFFG